MPILGLGTYQITNKEAIHTVVEAALSAGYRHIDTASGYQNEQLIGVALKELLPKFGLTRQDVFITSKIGPNFAGETELVLNCLEQSLVNLGTEYLDLCLIHWPGNFKLDVTDPRNKSLRLITWKALESVYTKGLVKAIGVSNYEIRHLEELKQCEVFPHVNQVELHPHYPQSSLLQYCKENNVALQAYSSLGTRDHCHKLLSDDTVVAVAAAVGRTPAQVLLCWALQQNIGVLPKSTKPGHIASNIECLEHSLSREQLQALSTLETSCKYSWDPKSVV
uniref:Uncharacterized oxidoreductase YtbE-like isoform X2 n=1 Tax=Hirondellea gigas TaxID=1518452 RepID=A0A6A7FQC7_9CRUS